MNLREAFGRALVELAPKYDFWAFDCDVANGTGVHHFKKAYPDRFVQDIEKAIWYLSRAVENDGDANG